MPATSVISEYKGRPIITFTNPERTSFPFAFGPGKAQLLLDFINIYGPEEFRNQLEKVAKKNE